jgi:pimeloyl-ACP methyl ester carboxylesterase
VFEEGLVARRGRARPPKHASVRDVAVKVREQVGACGWMHFFRAYMSTPGLALGGINLPVLILGGGRDISAFPADAHALAGALPQATCVILEDAGHFLFLQDPDAFVGAVEEFFAAAVESRPSTPIQRSPHDDPACRHP